MARPTHAPPVAVANSGGGAISAFRSAFAAVTPRLLRGAACARRLCRAGRPVALRRGLSSRCRRQVARRGLRPGRPHQHLRDRCRRLDHHAADRLGAGARPHARRPCGGDLREASQRLYPRALGRRRNRSLPAVLHPRRSRSARAISLCAQHDGRERGRHRRRLLAARRRDRVTVTHTDASGRAASWCRPVPRSVPATPCSSASAGSNISRFPDAQLRI